MKLMAPKVRGICRKYKCLFKGNLPAEYEQIISFHSVASVKCMYKYSNDGLYSSEEFDFISLEEVNILMTSSELYLCLATSVDYTCILPGNYTVV